MSATRKIVDYKVLNAPYYGALSDMVIKALADGWEPQGGIFVDSTPGAEEPYYQAMILRQP